MENAQQVNEVRTMVGGQHLLTPNQWALSLVRNRDADHAYLILEGVDDKHTRVCMDAHLVVKKSNDRKADIVLRGITVNQLKEVGEACHSYTWSISKAQAEQLITAIKAEKARADKDEINYVMAGKTLVNTFVSNSLWNESKESLENHSQNVSVDALTRAGHSCCSWAIAMIKSMHLPTPTNFTAFIACVPKDLVRGTHNGDEVLEEPTTIKPCSIM